MQSFLCLATWSVYNANPRECIERVRELMSVVKQPRRGGNAFRVLRAFQRTSRARYPVDPTIWRIRKEWLRTLPLQKRVHDFTIVHATLDTPANGVMSLATSTLSRVSHISAPQSAFSATHLPWYLFAIRVPAGKDRTHSHRAGQKVFH